MWTQNLMESKHQYETMFGWMRGKFKEFKWEYCWRKSFIDPIIKVKADIGGADRRDDGDVLFILGFLGFTVFLTVPDLIPMKYRYIWDYFDENGKSKPGNGMGRSYGFEWDEHHFSAYWHQSIGESSNRKPNPYGWGIYWWNLWTWDHSGTQFMNNDMQWQKELDFKDRDESAKIWTAPYKYIMRSGEVQETTATVKVIRRQWHWRLFRRTVNKWFGIHLGPVMREQVIDVWFSESIGAEKGSWKGGCTGCSYEMKKGETPLATLRRMERERKFERR